MMRESVFSPENTAQRQTDISASRIWTVTNFASRNFLEQHPSYILVAGDNALP